MIHAVGSGIDPVPPFVRPVPMSEIGKLCAEPFEVHVSVIAAPYPATALGENVTDAVHVEPAPNWTPLTLHVEETENAEAPVPEIATELLDMIAGCESPSRVNVMVVVAD